MYSMNVKSSLYTKIDQIFASNNKDKCEQTSRMWYERSYILPTM